MKTMNTIPYRPEWSPDILGHGFDMRHIVQPRDYSGHVRCTVIRRRATAGKGRGVLYVHGFSDYFFQKEMAEEFTGRNYDFYAVDLRKYGRSTTDEQKMFQVRDLSEYFPDISAGIEAMRSDGVDKIILLGHSTGGLTASLFLQRTKCPAVKALILNSPFLAWNLPWASRTLGIPVIKALARLMPSLKVSSSDGGNDYAASLSKHLGGEWNYDTSWKPDVLPDVDTGWIRAIDNAQKELRKGGIGVPVLLMHSARSARSGDSKERFSCSDGVLDVRSIAEAGRRLGPLVTDVTVDGGLHDLVLSRKDVRQSVYNTKFNWLSGLNL